MQAVEELVRRKLEKRTPDELSPKLDPYELRAPRGCSLLFPAAIANGGQSIMANFFFLITGHVIDKIVNQCAKPQYQYNTAQRLYRKHNKHTEDNKAQKTKTFGRRCLFIEERQLTGSNIG